MSRQLFGFQGCFSDSSEVFPAIYQTTDTLAQCLSSCQSNPNNTLCSFSTSRSCRGGSFINISTLQTLDTCTNDCPIVANGCGGREAASVFTVGFGNLSASTISQQSTSGIATLAPIHPSPNILDKISSIRVIPLGCHAVSNLSTSLVAQETVPEECLAVVQDDGYQFAALTHGGRLCFGTNSTVINITTTDCNLPCLYSTQFPSLDCGGITAKDEMASVYQIVDSGILLTQIPTLNGTNTTNEALSRNSDTNLIVLILSVISSALFLALILLCGFMMFKKRKGFKHERKMSTLTPIIAVSSSFSDHPILNPSTGSMEPRDAKV